MTAHRPLTVLYRGPLSSCNYDCGYCPFAKRKDSRATLAADRAALERFADWAAGRTASLSILFTPWGEAVVRRYYREAMVRLSHLSHVETVAIQTNLSHAPDWLAAADLGKAALWVTYHPGQTNYGAFLARVAVLERLKARYSIGVVALREHFDAIARLRADLPAHVYLWVNAEESLQGRYTADEVAFLAGIDPLFELNNRAYASQGRACAAGDSVISVRGDGEARPCHFVDRPIGNIYDRDFDSSLATRACPRAACDCHIGYSHMTDLDLRGLFGAGFVERRAVLPRRDDAWQRLAAFDTGPPATAWRPPPAQP